MRILHTSDWHLGAQLHDQSRLPEQTKFLDWLKEILRKEKPDALIVAGDIFDSGAPSNAALALYYDFLAAVFKEDLCRVAVVTGGNHDSPSLLDAPERAMIHLRTRIIGAAAYEFDDHGVRKLCADREVVVLSDADGQPALVVGAVPYLRDADLRTAEALESADDRTARAKSGLQEHYKTVVEAARRQGTRADGTMSPLVLTGHLYLTGAAVSDPESERALRIGNLESVERSWLPAADYTALGHLHAPQRVAHCETCRYSGSPIPMSFGEAKQEKSVLVVDFAPGADPMVRKVPIPVFQKLAQISGTPAAIEAALVDKVTAKEDVWVEARITEGDDDLAPLWARWGALTADSPVKLLRWINARPGHDALSRVEFVQNGTRLEDLTPEVLFDKLLQDEQMTDDERQTLRGMFDEIVRNYRETAPNQE